jgi:chromosomal replication initiator protein
MQPKPTDVWDKCLKTIRSEVSEQSFKTWFEPIVPLSFNENKLTIQVPSKFFYEWLEDKYVAVLKKAIDTNIGKVGQLEYSIFVDRPSLKSAIEAKQQNQPASNPKNKVQEPNFNKSPFELDLILSKQESYLNPAYTFDSYVEGDCNSLARSAGLAIAQRPGNTAFNPLMVYSNVGLGKTHLLQAIGNQIKHNYPDKFVLYVSSEKFTNQFINAAKNNSLQVFTNFYMNVDVLILDDVQFLAGKEKTQETFFHIFNHLHQTGKQIIMSSDRAPKKLEGFMERLLSRFKWGLTADLQKPDLETRIAIIEKKLEADSQKFSNEVVQFLAQNVNTNIRELEGVLISLMAQASLNRKEIDIELVKKTLKGIIKRAERELTMDQIVEAVSDVYKISTEELRGKNRSKNLILPRQLSIYLIKEMLITPLVNIGYFFDRDHSAIIYSVKAIEAALKTDPILSERCDYLHKKLKP